MNPLSRYTEINGLANFWNRDMTRLEWANWVYHHPEQTEELIKRLLSQVDYNNLSERVDILEEVDSELERQILEISQNSTVDLPELSDNDIDEITGVNPDSPPEPIDWSGKSHMVPLSDEEIDNITGVSLNG